jgi:hypothetical protein
MSLDVDCIAKIPVLDSGITQIREVRKSGVTLQEVSFGMKFETTFLTALEIITSSPPNLDIASFTTRMQSASRPLRNGGFSIFTVLYCAAVGCFITSVRHNETCNSMA